MLIDLIGGKDYLAINRKLIKLLGPAAAILYVELIDRYRYYEQEGKLDEEGMFYQTIETIEETIGLKRSQQDEAIKKLVEKGLIIVARKGLPAKRYFNIIHDPAILQNCLLRDSKKDQYGQIAENLQSRTQEISNQECKKSPDKTVGDIHQNVLQKDSEKGQNSQIAENLQSRVQEISNQECRKSANKNVENLHQTTLYKTNPNNKPNNNNNVVVTVFNNYGIDINPILRKFPDIFSNFTEEDVEKIARTLNTKLAEGTIINPVGLLLSDPHAIITSILKDQFFPPKKTATDKLKDVLNQKTKTEYEIYVPPTFQDREKMA